MIEPEDAERFHRCYTVSKGCWEWSRPTDKGYGRFWIKGKNGLAHRIAYEIAYGPIPNDLHIDHLCRNRSCVRPDHLEPVTLAENVLRGYGISAQNKRKSHCLRGHELAADNLWINPKTKSRSCKACQNQRLREWRKRKAS
jgi:hypothetical protein